MVTGFYQTPSSPGPNKKTYTRHVPTTPFRVLDAPGLRDDFYCSLLAYSPTSHALAVGLNSDVYSWSESAGARPFEHWSASHVTSLSFSTQQGGSNILAIGRIDGSMTLWNPSESSPRLEQLHGAGIACITWKPTLTKKHPSELPQSRHHHSREYVEELLVGDEMGNIYIYAVDWNHRTREATVVLLRRLPVHTQQICGLAWSPDGTQFVTGGNDNMAYLFDYATVVERDPKTGFVNQDVEPKHGEVGERYAWPHNAAVKAIAFCPWQKSLVATGKSFFVLVHEQLLT